MVLNATMSAPICPGFPNEAATGEKAVGLWERHDAIRGDASVDDQSEEHPHLRSVGAEGK
jgi:hypothetical protein